MEQAVDAYIRLRDLIDKEEQESKDLLRPKKEQLEQLGTALLGHLTASGVDSIAIKGVGTVFKAKKVSCSVGDPEEFKNWVRGQDKWDFINWAANKTAVTAMADSTGELPPGVKYSVSVEAQVRRARGT